MITASITLHGRPEKRTEVLQTIKGIVKELNKNTKCRGARIYKDVDDEDTLFFVEDWSSEDDLNDYFCSRLFKVLLGINPLLKDQLEITLFTEMKKITPEKDDLCQKTTTSTWEDRA